MIDWKPIESAPKDESDVLLWFPEPMLPKTSVGFWSEEDCDWYELECDSHSLTELYGNPTHWTELNPPSEH
jgi:hypothetical protein